MKERIWGVLGGLFLVAVGLGLGWYEGPLLLRDFGIASEVEAAREAKLVNGRCKSRLIIFFCDLTVDQKLADGTHKTELNYLFIDVPFSDHSVRLLSPKADRSIVTSDLGQDALWNRALTLAGMLVFCVVGGGFLAVKKAVGAQAPGGGAS
jgi:hypothetical protein